VRLYGWTEEGVARACQLASEAIGHGTVLEARNFRVVTERCRRGGQTIDLSLRFASQTCRKKDGSYPPGVLVRPSYYHSYNTVLDAIPMSELTGVGDRYHTERKTTYSRRSCAAPCWHGFGHFIRALFEINSTGCVVTAKARYDTARGFENKYPYTDGNIGSMMEPLQYSDACDCANYGVEEF
jgi:hypothetical protein